LGFARWTQDARRSGTEVTDDEIDLREYFGALWRRRYVVVAVALAAVFAVGLYSFATPPAYEAQALLLLAARLPPPPLRTEVIQDSTDPRLKVLAIYAEPRAISPEALAELAGSSSLQDELKRQVMGPSSKSKLPEDLSTQVGRSGDFVKFRVRGSDPILAERTANLWAEMVIRESAPLFPVAQSRDYPPLKLIHAVAPNTPVASRKALKVTLAGILGLMGGVVLAFVMEYFSPEPRTDSAPPRRAQRPPTERGKSG
jgi:capsular polysaccharide biosynthesis protein